MLVGEERCGKVTFGRVGQDGDDRLARTEALGELERGENVRAGGDARQKSFLGSEIAGAAERFLVSDHADVRVDLRIEIVGDESVADAHLEMCAHRAAREDGFCGSTAQISMPGFCAFSTSPMPLNVPPVPTPEQKPWMGFAACSMISSAVP